MRPVKIFAVILGILLALAGLALVTSGGFVLGVYGTQRDASGFFSSPNQDVGSYGFALTAPNINRQLGSRWERWVPSRARATVRITGHSLLPTSTPLFIGIGPTPQVSRYLRGVAHDKISRIDLMAGAVEYSHVDGTDLPAAPTKQDFWVAEADGTGTQTLDWSLDEGDWTVVIMNGDASAPVAASMNVGVRFGVLTTLVGALTGAGVVLLVIAATLLYFGGRRRRARPAGHAADYQRAVTYTPAPPAEPSPPASQTLAPQAPPRGVRPPQEPPLWG
jgi:hypothetical protein